MNTDHYKVVEKPNDSFGRTSFTVSSAGGIVEARIYGEQHRQFAQQLCDSMNGRPAVADPCRESCQRTHPHPKLSMARTIAPADRWFWSITLPGGHCYRVQSGFGSAEACASDMAATGVAMLAEAERALENMKHDTLQGNLTR